ARALAKGLDRFIHRQDVHGAEINKTNPARTVGGNLVLGHPTINRPPVIQQHVIGAIGGHWAEVANAVYKGPIDSEYATSDPVRRAGFDASIAVDRTGFEPTHYQPATHIAGATHENSAATHRRTR